MMVLLLLLLLLGHTTAANAQTAADECQPVNSVHLHQPQFHIIGTMQPGNTGTTWPGGVNDANAVFEHNGVFHVMHQCDGGGPDGLPCGGGHRGPARHPHQSWWHTWGHLVSRDGVHWKRVADALTPPPYDTPNDYEIGEDCDGTLTFTPEKGPVIMFGPSCDPPRAHGADNRSKGRREDVMSSRMQLGDAAKIGFATATNASDPELIEWTKASEPVTFDGTPCSFPGKIWKSAIASADSSKGAASSKWNMLCAVGNAWARYSSAGDSLRGPWKLQDHSFASVSNGKAVGGSGGASFLPLPHPAAGEPTHIIADGANAVFQYGTYDQATEKLELDPGLFPLDSGTLAWQAAGVAQSDGRILAVGWVHAADKSDPQALKDGCPKVGGIQICGVQAISATRVVSYEAKTRMLNINFAAEYSKLRNATLVEAASVRLGAGQAHSLTLPHGKGLAMDLEISVELPTNEAVFLQTTIMADPSMDGSGTGGVTLQLNISAPNATGHRMAIARTSGNIAPTPFRRPFPVMPEEKTLSVRALVDRSIVEFMLADGRSAFTARYYPNISQTGVRLLADKAVTLSNVSAFEMGCGWAA